MDTPLYNCLSKLNYNNPLVINGLKEEFATVLASPRTLRYIKDVRCLLHILRKRDCINRETLNCILSKLDPHIINKYYANNPSIRIPAGFHVNNAPSMHQNEKLQRIYNIICEDLGPKHMREMARSLNIKESKIDELSKHQTSSECILHILYYHEEHCHPAMWRKSLLDALMNARRMDVYEKVELKLDEYNIIQPY